MKANVSGGRRGCNGTALTVKSEIFAIVALEAPLGHQEDLRPRVPFGEDGSDQFLVVPGSVAVLRSVSQVQSELHVERTRLLCSTASSPVTVVRERLSCRSSRGRAQPTHNLESFSQNSLTLLSWRRLAVELRQACRRHVVSFDSLPHLLSLLTHGTKARPDQDGVADVSGERHGQMR